MAVTTAAMERIAARLENILILGGGKAMKGGWRRFGCVFVRMFSCLKNSGALLYLAFLRKIPLLVGTQYTHSDVAPVLALALELLLWRKCSISTSHYRT